MIPGLPGKQKGAAAIEFALVFVIFFAVLYGLVSYSLPMLMVQSFNAATAEGVRQGAQVDPVASGNNYATLLKSTATAAAAQRLQWIPAALSFNASSDITATYTGGLLTVSIQYPTSRLRSVLPFLVLPGIGTVPNLPANLKASASMQF
ncbi:MULTISPECIES: TadE/TadG family type IV pilus assembly protein [Pseudomonas]|uniref:TadE-like protein n=1 Tax=Pseudomonas asplenii TaxID=53407 RepID=A0A0M9GJC3_9PSED|nr:TadE/TadG family type IV pilus assembly protein [Pseudomonas fuscovaginae]KPA92650.1 TadE-like protein [Pseudomonas fuscovaginae]KPA95446.1 TadE-like protein [Pseudomonas fuscovaginae]